MGFFWPKCIEAGASNEIFASWWWKFSSLNVGTKQATRHERRKKCCVYNIFIICITYITLFWNICYLTIIAAFGREPNIMLGHNVIYVDTICLCGLHGWSSDSHQSNLSFKSQSFLSPWGSVRIKERAFPRSSPLTFTITAITSQRKFFFVRQVLLYFTISITFISVMDLTILHFACHFFSFLVHFIFIFLFCFLFVFFFLL